MKDKRTLFDITTNILNRIKEVLEEVRPDVVLVHGDTTTIFVTALACFYLQIPVGHVEAGLRTYNIFSPYPDVKAIYPIHMNPIVRETADAILSDDERIYIIEPLDVLDFHNFRARSYMILTDSGGIQEVPSLGKPVLVMRDTTERPEEIKAGTLKLVGANEETIYTGFKRLLTDKTAYDKMAKASNPYGDGHACARIADIFASAFLLSGLQNREE